MAYINPSTSLEFYNNINLSPNYENSLYFDSLTSKDSYFENLTKIATCDTCTYQRGNRGVCRVEVPIGVLYNANYMRFRNAEFEPNKWFYAFVTDVNYVNNVTTEIVFQLDYIMTWMGTFTLGQCYVEREHVANDNIGAYIADEGLPTGEYVLEGSYSIGDFGAMGICIAVATEDGSGGGLSGGIYHGCEYFLYNSYIGANNKIQELVQDNQADSIINIFTVPLNFSGSTLSDAPVTKYVTLNKPYESLNGYVPKNKKLFTYPYKYLTIDNMEGSTKDYKYEFFNTLPDATSSGVVTFKLIGTVSSGFECKAVPENYRHDTVSGGFDSWGDSIGMDKFPQCAWSVDTYKAYVAQKNAWYPLQNTIDAYQGAYQVTKSAFQGAVSALTMDIPDMGRAANNAVDALDPIVNRTIENMALNDNQVSMPIQSKGSACTDAVVASGNKTFRAYEKCLSKNYAMMIDDYFSMYGYAIRQCITPNMNIRPHWTYIKTIGCNVNGKLPAKDKAIIEKIFDRGIRFWKNNDEIGNYSLDNSPA